MVNLSLKLAEERLILEMAIKEINKNEKNTLRFVVLESIIKKMRFGLEGTRERF